MTVQLENQSSFFLLPDVRKKGLSNGSWDHSGGQQLILIVRSYGGTSCINQCANNIVENEINVDNSTASADLMTQRTHEPETSTQNNGISKLLYIRVLFFI